MCSSYGLQATQSLQLSLYPEHSTEAPVGQLKPLVKGFPGGAVVKNPPANAGDTGSSPGPGRSHILRSN